MFGLGHAELLIILVIGMFMTRMLFYHHQKMSGIIIVF